MTLPPGTRVGSYAIIGALGAGGMGEVFRAHDTRLGRDVALKFLPDVFARDPDRRMRFEREAKTLAALNHPHIAAIYGVENIQESSALVMELVEGDDLSERLADGALPIEETIAIARQIAAALEAAHRAGIIHRDLKPANIKVRPDGTAKVLDFGLAKALDPATASPAADALANSPTITSPALTAMGVIFGTAAYMAPEQAKGKPVDQRADIWAFGCVLYEMLTGRRAFRGEDVSDALAAILRTDPDWSALPAGVPSNVRRVLRHCLEKDPRRRWRDMGDVQVELDDDVDPPTPGLAAPVARPRFAIRVHLAWLTVALVAAASTAALVWRLRAPAPSFETRLDITAPATLDLVFALSPDGRSLVFSAEADGKPVLWLRALDTTTARPLPGSEGGTSPFWSPDGGSIGFIAGGKLKRLDLSSGTTRELGPGIGGAGASWGPAGILLGTSTGLYRIPTAGGDRVFVLKVEGGAGHQQPQFLPDGNRFIFFCNGPLNVRGVYLSALDDPTAIRLTDADAAARYVAPGWLLYIVRGSLVARSLDVERRALSGEVMSIAEDVRVDTSVSRRASYSVAADGTIAYIAGAALRNQLTWFNRHGSKVATLGEPGPFITPRLSSDGRRASVASRVGVDSDIWIVDAVRTTRLTVSAAKSRRFFAVWSQDDSRIAYTKLENSTSTYTAVIRPATGGGAETTLAEIGPNMTDWSRDGRYILVDKAPTDIWVIPTDGKAAFPFIDKTSFDERLAHFSPDGHWVVYQSNESGRAEIYIRPFPPAEGQWPVSNAGGAQPHWSRNGNEIYWIAPDATLMTATVTIKPTSVDVGVPTSLFPTQIYMRGSENPNGGQYDVSVDGRFLINTVVDQPSSSVITILHHWRGFGL